MDEIHRQAVLSVKAEAQARMLKYIEDALTDEERDIVRREGTARQAISPKMRP